VLVPFKYLSFRVVVVRFFCLSFRSEAKESASAVALVLAVPLAFLFVIPQRSEGICLHLSLPLHLPFVCHSAAKRRNLLFHRRLTLSSEYAAA
jgi:hypothetical protein